MGLFSNLLFSIIHLVLLAIDIVSFFVLVRLLCYRWKTGWLKALDATGAPVVDGFTGCIRKTASRLTKKTYTPRAQLITAMLVLVLIRTLLVALFSK